MIVESVTVPSERASWVVLTLYKSTIIVLPRAQVLAGIRRGKWWKRVAALRARQPHAKASADVRRREMTDVRAAFSELIAFYRQALHGHEPPRDFKLHAAQLLQHALNDYLRLLNVTEIQQEIEQTQRIVAEWRGGLPGPFDGDDERTPGCP